MKNPPDGSSRPAIAITATMQDASALQLLVETLAQSKAKADHSLEEWQPGWRNIARSSVEVYVSGNINLSRQQEDINVPFITSFFFTCTKEMQSHYGITWSNSLS